MSELTAAHSTIEKAREVTNCPDGVDLQDHLKALVAENIGFRQLSSEVYDEMVSHHDTDGLYSLDADGEPMDALIRLCDAQATIYEKLVMLEAPATDSILRAAEARGVEMAARELERIDTIAGTRVMAFKLRECAQLLREGKA
ncbi:hypothetical protein [Escherichia coli]|uniref:hypothetical protein n=1 Tax=Escherichia coli TaxID=562 RepID=UPI000BE9BA8B|nr:hypothetical protein [Escherichia coli]